MAALDAGQAVPNVTFKVRADTDWVDVTTDDLFKGKTVVVFALPGAYTPTCSSTHVPRYNKLAGALKANGVDDIICLSVNDGFVMDEWKEDQGAEHIRFIPDGNVEFTRGMGMEIDLSVVGFGERSKRYSMLVKDGVIDKLFLETAAPGAPLEASDADTMLAYIAPNAPKPADVAILTKKGCPFCAKAKTLLKGAQMDYDELVLNQDIPESSIRALTGQSTFPQVFIDGKHIGGCDDLEAHLAK
jgi:glutaredoxin-like protein